MEFMERLTPQKKIILDYLKSVKTHPSAEEVYNAVKKKLPHLSLGTVYRILKKLKEKGEIVEINYNISHFDGDTSPHMHFICENCNKIFDIFEKDFPFSKNKIKVGKIKNYQVYIYGVCKKCLSKKSKK